MVVGALTDGPAMNTPRWDVHHRISRLLLHGVCVENLLSGRALRAAPWWAESILAVLLGAGALMLGRKLRSQWNSVLWIGMFFVYLMLVMAAFHFIGFDLPMAIPLLALFAGSSLPVWKRLFVKI